MTTNQNEIKAENYRRGYQAALADILAALEDGGEDAVNVWIADNYSDPRDA